MISRLVGIYYKIIHENGWKRLMKWHRLPIQNQLLVIQSFIVVLVIQVGLRLLSFQQFKCLYMKLIAMRGKTEIPIQSIERKIWAIQLVSRPLSAFCLPQALALICLLKADKEVKLIVGIQKTHKFEAHAWVEKDGVILLGELPNFSFKPIWTWN